MPLLTHVIWQGGGYPRILFLLNGDLTYYKARVRRSVIQTLRAHIAYQFSEKYLNREFEFIVYQPIAGQHSADGVPYMFDKELLDSKQPILMSYSVKNMKLAEEISAELRLLGVPRHTKDHPPFALKGEWQRLKIRRGEIFLLDFYDYGWKCEGREAHEAILTYELMIANDARDKRKKLGFYKMGKTKAKEASRVAAIPRHLESWDAVVERYNDAMQFLEDNPMAQR